MELRRYWNIVLRRWWLIALLVLATLAVTWVLSPHPATVYVASVRVTVGIQPEDGAGKFYTYDRYYAWMAAEYLADDLSEVVRSQAFAGAVVKRTNLPVPAGAIAGATMAGKTHRILTITVTWGNPDDAKAIANAAVAELRENGQAYLAQLGSENAQIHVIDEATVGPVSGGLREQLDLPIRLGLALAAGVALAFLLDYLDDSVRDAAELEARGFTVLGRIPRRRWDWLPGRRARD
jgi:capsular polysaccharide biosynthesis protein